MKLKDVIKITALLIGRTDVCDYLKGLSENAEPETLKTVDAMVTLANLVINELATTYVPLVKRESVRVSDGKVYYDDFSEKILKIRKVYGADGIELDFKTAPEYLSVCGYSAVSVEYEYTPHNRGIDEETGYEEGQLPERVLSYGVAAEYFVSVGRFEEAVTWHKRYVDALSALLLPKNRIIKKRCWF